MVQPALLFDAVERGSLVDQLPDPIWIVSPPDRVVFANAAFCGYLGRDSGHANWLASVHPDDAFMSNRQWASSLNTMTPLRVSCRLRGKNDEYRWFLVQARILLDENSETDNDRRWLFSAHDIHDQKVRECTLTERLRLQVAMVNASIDCIKVINPDGNLKDMNKSGCVALGVPESSEFGMDWLSLLPEEVRTDGRAALDAARRGENSRFPGCSRLPGETPRYWDNILTPVLDTQGRTASILCLSRDVTAQRQLEEQLRSRNRNLEADVNARTEELERLWNTSQDLLAVISPEGRIIRANPAWQAVLGYEAGELLGQQALTFVAPEDVPAARDALGKVGRGNLQSVEIRHVHKDHSVRWVSWIGIRSGDQIYASGRHTTAAREADEKLRRTEEALRHAQKVEAIGRLTGSVAHDFNNFLAVIRDSLILFRMANLPEDRRARCLELMASTTDRAITVTRQLLDFARQSPCDPTIFSVAQRLTALQDMIEMLSGKGIQVSMDVGDEPCCALADPSQFDTALVNIAVNARDAMEGSGTLSIAVRPATLARDTWRRRDQVGDFVAVSITDTGPGIPEEHIEHIFEPFFTTKKSGLGTGLGLSQVVGFAVQSGGTVGVENTPPSGATFTVYLPRASSASV